MGPGTWPRPGAPWVLFGGYTRIWAVRGDFGETVPWVVGIVGFLLLRQGLSYLAPMAPWNPFK
ncbi:hypothetical protein ACX80Q_14155 [Arthrobacter sp. HLT1-20]